MENITVAVRCRGLIEEERKCDSPEVVFDQGSKEVCVVDESTGGKKIFSATEVFGSSVSQETFFKKLVSPFYQSFWEGYNVSVMGYGAISSGKSYTLNGEYAQLVSTDSIVESSGAIPRVLSQLFEDLEKFGNDYIVKCSFVEIFGEELKDLLAESNSNGNVLSNTKKLRIIDSLNIGTRSASNSNSSTRDNSPITNSKNVPTAIIRKRMGKKSLTTINSNPPTSSNRLSLSRTNSFSDHSLQNTQEKLDNVYIQNLQELSITNFTEGMALLKKGLKNRRIASTTTGSFSKRSHTIFTITLYKEEEVNELFRISKLNFVNFAGWEYGEANQNKNNMYCSNLQNFNKMMNGFLSNSSYIPYADSKLTQLLQNNFNGITKTLFIANISPLKKQFDSTCSVLSMATKIQEIKNKPTLGSFITKETLIKILSNELVKTKSDLLSVKSKDDGVYMDEGHYSELTKNLEGYKTKVKECKKEIEDLTNTGEELRREKRAYEENNELQRIKLQNIKETIKNLGTTLEKQNLREKELENIRGKLQKTIQNMQKSVDMYSDKEIHLQHKLRILYDEELVKLKNLLENNFQDIKNRIPNEDESILQNVNNVKKEIFHLVKDSQSKVKDILSNGVNRVLDSSPEYFEKLDDNLRLLEKTIKTNHTKYSELLSDISEEFNSLKNYISDNFLKSNHDEIIDTYINKTYHDVQIFSDELINNFENLMNVYMDKSTKSLTDSIKSLSNEIVEDELNQFNPERKKWESSLNLIEMVKETVTKNKDANADILKKLMSESELSKHYVANNINSIEKEVNVIENFSEIFATNEDIKREFAKTLSKNKRLKKLLNDNFDSSENSIKSFDNLNDVMQKVFKNEIEESYSNDTVNLQEIFEQMEQQRVGVNSSVKKKPFKYSSSPTKLSPIKSSTKLNSPLRVDIQSLSEVDIKKSPKRKLEISNNHSNAQHHKKIAHK